MRKQFKFLTTKTVFTSFEFYTQKNFIKNLSKVKTKLIQFKKIYFYAQMSILRHDNRVMKIILVQKKAVFVSNESKIIRQLPETSWE